MPKQLGSETLEPTKFVSFILFESELQALTQAAVECGRTRSEVLRTCVAQFLREHAAKQQTVEG